MEPSNIASHFLILAKYSNSVADRGVIISVDFDLLHETKC